MENLVSYYTYIGLLLITLLVSWITNKKYYSVKLNFTYNDYTELNYLIYINLLFIAFFVAFRYELGVDWYSYREFFLSGNFTAGKFEVGYKLLNSIVSSLNGDYTTVFFIISFTSWLFLFKGFPRQLLLLGAFFLFCDEWFFISTNLVRQFFAASILLFSLKSFSNEKKYKFLLLILFASTFHKAVLIFIPLLIIPWKNIYNRNVWLLLYSTSLIFRHNDYLIHQVIKITDILSTYLPIFSSYTGYFNSYLFDASNVTLSNYGILFRSLIAVYIILYSKPIINKYPSVKIYYFIFIYLLLFVLFIIFFCIKIR